MLEFTIDNVPRPIYYILANMSSGIKPSLIIVHNPRPISLKNYFSFGNSWRRCLIHVKTIWEPLLNPLLKERTWGIDVYICVLLTTPLYDNVNEDDNRLRILNYINRLTNLVQRCKICT